MSALDEIKAGKYVLIALQWDEITSKPGQPLDFVRHRKGDEVTLDVEQARRLVTAGAVAKPGSPPATPGAEPSEPPTEPTTGQTPLAATGNPPAFVPEEGGTIEQTLAYVGNDPAKASAMLEAEKGKGEDARSTLVGKLEAIVADAQGGS